MTERTKARYLGHVTTASTWYLNTQSTADKPWGDVHHGSDEGRFIYEVFKGSRWCRGMGVWGQALAVMNLLDVAGRTSDARYKNAGLAGVRYLLSLQCLDCRRKELQGAFWEHFPNDVISLVRDGATGCFALNYMYAHTGDKEYLERARLFCDWYMAYGSKKENCWPYLYFDFKGGKGHSKIEILDPNTKQMTMSDGVDGDWQAGGALAYYYTALQSGDKKYLEEGLRPVLDKVVRIYDESGDKPEQEGFHGRAPIVRGNDDFVFTALAAGFRAFKDERYLKHLKKRTKIHLSWMDADGSYPNFAGTFVSSIEHMEYLRLAQEFGFSDHVDEVKAAIEKSAQYGLTLQERENNDPLYYGGLYGQSSFGVERDRIHQRDVAYSINMYLKLEGGVWPKTLSSYGWGADDKVTR